MTIAELRERSNTAISGVPKDLLLVGIVLLFSTASFGLGMLAEREMGAGQGDGFFIEAASSTVSAAVAEAPLVSASVVAPAASAAAIAPATGKYIASKNGTKYYLPSCSGAKRIKEANRVWFATVADAVQAGYSAASNCPGL